MRVLLVNWAKIWDGATNGGGVNGYCQSLALELVARGHDVACLSGGTTFAPSSLVAHTTVVPGQTSFRRHPDWLGVRVFEVVNSPVLAPASYQFREPLGEASAPGLEAAFAAFIERLAPDVVHFHNIEGFSAGCIDAARAARGRPRATVVYSLHNYHTVCPQVYLMHQHVKPCQDYQSGRACIGCVAAVEPGQERAKRAAEYAAAAGVSMEAWRGMGQAASTTEPKPRGPSLAHDIKQLLKRMSAHGSAPADPTGEPPSRETLSAIALPGQGIGDSRDTDVPLPVLGADKRGQTASLVAERDFQPPCHHEDPTWKPLENTIVISRESRELETDYAVRRRAMVTALNGCDAVLAVSDFVREKFVSLGVRRDLIRTNHIGTRVNSVARRFPELLFDPPTFEPSTTHWTRQRPIRLVFMGYNNVYKGLPMLADALELLTPEYLRRFHLSIFAQAGETIEWRFRRMEPRLAGLTMIHGYQYFDIPWMLGGKDLGLVTSVWWDNAPQTVFEYFACGVPILAANLGGIPDFVTDGRNGLLFRGNDRYDLARRLAEVAREPGRLAEYRRNVRPPKDMPDHAEELEKLYAACLSSPPRPEPAGSLAAPSAGRTRE